MKKFTIQELEKFSGVKANTIRAWENRFRLLQPGRTPGNTRVYTVEELTKLLDIAVLNRNGYSISRLVNTDATDIDEKLAQLKTEKGKWEIAINSLVRSMYLSPARSFEVVLDNIWAQWPSDIVVTRIIHPFLRVTGLLWEGHQLSEEHFVVTAVRRKIIVAIESLPPALRQQKTIVLFLFGTRQLDLGLLLANYTLKKCGHSILYMGNDVNLDNLENVLSRFQPFYLFTYNGIKQAIDAQIIDLINKLSPGTKLLSCLYGNTRKIRKESRSLLQMNYQDAIDFLCIRPS